MEMIKKTKEDYLKDNRVKILDAIGKAEKKYLEQANNWFKMNSNRKVIKMKLSPTEIIVVLREEVLETL